MSRFKIADDDRAGRAVPTSSNAEELLCRYSFQAALARMEYEHEKRLFEFTKELRETQFTCLCSIKRVYDKHNMTLPTDAPQKCAERCDNCRAW